MVYRHIYWGLLNIGPSGENDLTEAVKPKAYLVKIITKNKYKTKEEAEGDDMKYVFHVWRDEIILEGSSQKEKDRILKDGGNCENLFEAYDYIDRGDWPRYRMILLDKGAVVSPEEMDGALGHVGRPTARRWEKIFPVRGEYPVKKVAYSLIALPDAEDEGDGDAKTR